MELNFYQLRAVKSDPTPRDGMLPVSCFIPPFSTSYSSFSVDLVHGGWFYERMDCFVFLFLWTVFYFLQERTTIVSSNQLRVWAPLTLDFVKLPLKYSTGAGVPKIKLPAAPKKVFVKT